MRESADSSAAVTRHTLAAVLERSLRLLHPFAPFVTEEVWQSLMGRPAENSRDGIPASIMIAPWPQAGESDPEAEEQDERGDGDSPRHPEYACRVRGRSGEVCAGDPAGR